MLFRLQASVEWCGYAAECSFAQFSMGMNCVLGSCASAIPPHYPPPPGRRLFGWFFADTFFDVVFLLQFLLQIGYTLLWVAEIENEHIAGRA